MLLPLSFPGIAAGVLAGLSAAYGLYTTFVPPLLYVFLGRSLHISLGCFGITSIQINLAMQKPGVAPDGSLPLDELILKRANIATTMAFCIGILQATQ